MMSKQSPECGTWRRAAATLLALLNLTAVLSPVLTADTILLKNGRRIVAESISEEGDKVFYEDEGGRISIPRSLVDRIEKDGAVPPPPTPLRTSSPSGTFARAMDVQITVPQKDAEGVVRGGAVDEERLKAVAALASKGDLERRNAVNSYLVAAAFEARNQRPGPASKWADEALRLSPQDPNALLLASHIDIVRQQYSEALNHLFLAQSLRPDSPEVLTLLGYTYYYLEGPEKANRYWRQANSLRPDPKLQDLIQQTDREEKVEGGFVQAQSNHFVLNREGSEISDSFSRQILETLEQHYRDLEAALDITPREPFVVILYPAQEFADITRSPGWVGALNDGKIRVPVRGLSSMTTELSRVLKHEMVHSFVHFEVQGRCPTWLNEGLAQLESGERPALSYAALGRFYADSRQIPLAQLESSFMGFSTGMAAVAYTESLAAVAMMRDKYGPFELGHLLKVLGEGKTMTEALHQLFGTDYAELESDLSGYLAKR